MTLSRPLRSAWAVVVLVGLLLSVGCDTTLAPFDDEAGTFSIRGYLSISDDTHFFRVKDLRSPLIDDSTRTLDVTVTMENLTAGTSSVLEDSTVAFEGVYTHNYRYDGAVQTGATYRITVEHVDGRTAQSTATVPPLTDIGIEPQGAISCAQRVFYSFRNVPAPRLLRFFVEVDWRKGRRWVAIDNPTEGSGTVPVKGFAPADVIASVVPTRERAAVQNVCDLLKNNYMRVAYTHFGPDWPADSIVANPLGSNVEGGLGIFGGLHRDTLRQAITLPRR
jgi:hypothetical protein